MQRFSVKTRLGFRCLNEDTTAVRAVCSSVLGLESPSYVIAPVRGTPPPPFVSIPGSTPTITSCDSSVKIRVNPWRKKLSTATAAISTVPGLESPSYMIAPVRGPPNTTPFVSIRGSKHHSIRGHSWFKTPLSWFKPTAHRLTSSAAALPPAALRIPEYNCGASLNACRFAAS
jgi:hypothetical protein